MKDIKEFLYQTYLDLIIRKIIKQLKANSDIMQDEIQNFNIFLEQNEYDAICYQWIEPQ